MTDKEIFKKAVFMAKDKGMKRPFNIPIASTGEWVVPIDFGRECDAWIILSSNFAKAFWGEEEEKLDMMGEIVLQKWKHHLQQMVLEENPIDYLRKFVKSKYQEHGEKMEDECINHLNKSDSDED